MTPTTPPGLQACSFIEREAKLLDGLGRIRTLSPREAEVLHLLRTGPTDAEVARLLRISTHTVRFHTKAISRKLGGITRQEVCLVALAHHGLYGLRHCASLSRPMTPGAAVPPLRTQNGCGSVLEAPRR